MNNEAQYKQWRDKLLKGVGNLCRQCVDPRKENATLDYDNPLNCSCRCSVIEGPLSNLEGMMADIEIIHLLNK